MAKKNTRTGVFVAPEGQSSTRTKALRVAVWLIIGLIIFALAFTLGPAMVPQPVPTPVPTLPVSGTSP